MSDAAAPRLLEACWRDLVLGIVQGLTEFLPISSTAHLKVVPVMLGWGDPGVSVTAAIQLGSIVAVIAYFRKDLAGVLKGISRAVRHGLWREPEARLGLAMAVGTLPILAVGLAIKLFWDEGYENSPLRSVPSIAIVSIVMAGLLALAERIGPRRKQLAEVSGRDGLVVGLMLALIPGVLRQHPHLLDAETLRPPPVSRFCRGSASPLPVSELDAAATREAGLLIGIVSATIGLFGD